MIFFNYIFFRSYMALIDTKYKINAEARSIAMVTVIQGAIFFSLMMVIFKFTGFYNNVHIYNEDSHNLKYIISLPLVFLFWYLNERYYKKKSKDNYAYLKKKFKNSIFNNIVPFWVIFLIPFILIFGTPFILSLIE